MSEPLAIEKKSSRTSKVFFSSWLPKGALENIFLWTFLPFALLVLTGWMGYLMLSPFTPMLPLFILVGTLACSLGKTIGLSASYLVLFSWILLTRKQLSSDQLLWQMGLILSLAIDYFIVLLSVEEIKAAVGKIVEASHERLNTLNQKEVEIRTVQQTSEEKKQQLEQQIKKLKEELEQSGIEKQRDHKRFELIQSEIEILTGQKEAFIAEAFEARKIANQTAISTPDNFSNQILFESQEKILSLQVALSQRNEEKRDHLTDKERGAYATEMDQLGIQVVDLEEEISCLEELVSHVLSQ